MLQDTVQRLERAIVSNKSHSGKTRNEKEIQKERNGIPPNPRARRSYDGWDCIINND